ncbi:hypothetical protein [Pedobacter sp. P26]|uniref:hypothetical protein n=1 Tax=Pedobacter sp. P26 TaxID=3423956 RepID=UPI003D66BE2F
MESKSDAPIISKHIYGQFAEHLGRSIYDGFYRNGKIREDIVAALKKSKFPIYDGREAVSRMNITGEMALGQNPPAQLGSIQLGEW